MSLAEINRQEVNSTKWLPDKRNNRNTVTTETQQAKPQGSPKELEATKRKRTGTPKQYIAKQFWKMNLF